VIQKAHNDTQIIIAATFSLYCCITFLQHSQYNEMAVTNFSLSSVRFNVVLGGTMVLPWYRNTTNTAVLPCGTCKWISFQLR